MWRILSQIQLCMVLVVFRQQQEQELSLTKIAQPIMVKIFALPAGTINFKTSHTLTLCSSLSKATILMAYTSINSNNQMQHLVNSVIPKSSITRQAATTVGKMMMRVILRLWKTNMMEKMAKHQKARLLTIIHQRTYSNVISSSSNSSKCKVRQLWAILRHTMAMPQL